MKIGFHIPEGSSVDLAVTQGSHIATARIARWGQAHLMRSAKAGRVNVLPLALVDTPEGRVIPRLEGTTLDLRNSKAGGSFIATLEDRRKLLVETTPRQQLAGFAPGEHYYLPVDPTTGRVRLRPGRNHNTVHVSNRAGAYTRAMIAAEAGLPGATQVTLDWLRANPAYASQEKPMTPAAAQELFAGGQLDANRYSLWLLLERGYSYPALPLPGFKGKGQSPLHPLVIGAWGEGEQPSFPAFMNLHPWKQNLIWQDVDFKGGLQHLSGINIMVDGATASGQMTIQDSIWKLTYRHVRFLDIHRQSPVAEGVTNGMWNGFRNRLTGAYVGGVTGLLVDGCHFDYIGWREGYSPDLDPAHPMPPSQFSHCLYIASSVRDVLTRDTLASRGASKGLDNRAGGYSIDCVTIDNNIPHPLSGGNYEKAGPVGQYGVMLGNLTTVAGRKNVSATAHGAGSDYQINGVAWGLDGIGREGSRIGCIIAHAGGGSAGASTLGAYFDDTIERNWHTDRNLPEGVSLAQMDATTIQNFTDQALAATGSELADFYAYARTQQPRDLARSILTFFRQGFGIHVPLRTTPATATFQPDDRAEGCRWDNRLNWTTDDIPGAAHLDTVDLHGYDVRFGNHTAHIASLSAGGGALDVVSGELMVDAAPDALTATVRDCGQLWLGAVAAGSRLTATGGLLGFSGAASGHDLTVAGDQTEVLLGADHTIAAGRMLDLRSAASLVGWDGAGNATLALAGTLRLSASMVIDSAGGNSLMQPGSRIIGATSGFTAIAEGCEPVNNATSPWTYRIWLRDLSGVPVVGETWTGTPIPRPFHVANANFDPDTADHDDPRWNPTVTPTGTITGIVRVAMPRIAPFVSGIHGAGDPTVAANVALSGALELDLTGLAAGSHPLIEAAVTGTFSAVTATGLNPALDATVTVTAQGVMLALAQGTGQVVLVTAPTEPPAPALPRVSVTGGQITPFSRGGVDYVEIRFDQSGSFSVAEALGWHRRAMAAGGGTGGRSERETVMPGAGGAGGFTQVLDTALAAGSYTVTIGAGAPGYATGVIGQANGGNSRLTGPGIDLSLTGGGSGGSYKIGANFEIGTLTGLPGGSGGGGRATSGGGMAGGAGISGQGHQGGAGNGSAVSSAGGSGGAGGIGGNGGAAPSTGGPAGAGVVLDWIATPRTVCAGERGLVGADKGASSPAREYGSGSRGAVNGAVGKGGDGFLFIVLRADQAHVVAA